MGEVVQYLDKLPFWPDLTEAEQQALVQRAYVRHYNAETVVESFDSCLGMVYILSGEVRAFFVSEEGREITLYRLYPEDICVLSTSCVISHISFETYMMALQETDVLIIPADLLTDLTERNVYFRCFLSELTAERFSTVVWVLQQILFGRFDQRLASFLLSEYKRTGDPQICMTQEQIAVEVNSAREVVARMLKQFVSEGLVESGRGTITLKNFARLEKISGS